MKHKLTTNLFYTPRNLLNNIHLSHFNTTDELTIIINHKQQQQHTLLFGARGWWFFFCVVVTFPK